MKPALWIGASGFQYPEWKPAFYPADLSRAKMLSFYAGHFNSTEINYSFRRIPSEKTLSAWAAATPPSFKFSFKAPQRITHFARLQDCLDTLTFFAAALASLGSKLGPVLFQLPPNFQKDTALLRAFLETIPPPVKPAFEFRHPSWFTDETFATLRAHDAALCIAESETLATPGIATASFGYLRLRRVDYTPSQIESWAKFIAAQAKWADAFIYFKHEEHALGPKFATQLIKVLQKG